MATGRQDSAVCHNPSVNVSNMGCDPLSTSKPWLSAIRLPNSTLSLHQYLLVFSVDFCHGFDY
jgi:hypothetical protein